MNKFSKTKQFKDKAELSVDDFKAMSIWVKQLHSQFKSKDNKSLKSFANTRTPTIITGYQGLPLLETAKFMAKQKFCPSVCLHCVTCESVDKESSVHLKIVRPEGKSIKVDQVRQVIEFLSFKRDHETIVIIDQAHLMNLHAANAILKTIEEPPQNCWIVLTAPSIKNMLSTVRSRCLVYKSRPIDFSDFKGISEIAQNNSALMQGRWDWALKSDEVLGSIQDVKKWLLDFKKSSETPVLMDWMKGRDGLSELISYIKLLTKLEIRYLDTSTDSNAINLRTPLKWVGLVDRLNYFEASLNTNADPKLVEDLLTKAVKDNYVFH